MLAQAAPSNWCNVYRGCALYIGPILFFTHWTNCGPILFFKHWTNSVLYTLDQSGPIQCFIHWTNTVLYTLDQFCALYTGPIWTNSVLHTLAQYCALYNGPILCFIHWTKLDQFSALYIGPILCLYTGPILCFIHWANSKKLLVLTRFPDEGTAGVPKHATRWKETVYRLCLLLVLKQLVRHAECEIMHGHTILQQKYRLPTKPVTLSDSPPHTQPLYC